MWIQVTFPSHFLPAFVLIDTWWNVNSHTPVPLPLLLCFNRYMVECEFLIQAGSVAAMKVLIDTWWNVNHNIINDQAQGYQHFNRYMVECECIWCGYKLIIAIRFNRYMVECEFHMIPLKASAVLGFNRYMVECEWWFVEVDWRWCRVLIDTWWNVNYDRLACRKEAFEF